MHEYIAPLLIAVNIIISAVLLIVFSAQKKKSENSEQQIKALYEKLSAMSFDSRHVADELQRNRTELAASQKIMRDETSSSMQKMADELLKMRKDSYDYQLKMNEMISQSLGSMRKENSEQTEKQNLVIRKSIEEMQKSNELRLEKMRETVDEKLTKTLTTRLNSSFKTVSEQLENVYKSLGEMKNLSAGVTDLNKVLTNVKARGTWAEVQLERILEETIPSMYDKNVSTKANTEKVEFAVRIPSSDSKDEPIWLPIDSKFPVESYIRLNSANESGDAALVIQARKEFEASVTAKAKEITKYINVPETTPFAIMYLATEGLYAEVASSKTGLLERLHNDFNIMVAGPSTVTALLNSLSVGFRAVAINEKAAEVRKLLAAARTQYEKFGLLLEKARKKVDEAGKVLDDAQSRNNIITKKLKNVELLEQNQSEEILGIGSFTADDEN
ncbi:MAG: DNA recombination protein RmuC [Clostridia bacterium]|nr:DNA recombination protein RmuC [Clostridia bacterium]